MAAEMRAFCDKLAAKCQQKTDVISVEDWVKNHKLPVTAAPAAAAFAAAAAAPAAATAVAPQRRNDLRTIPAVGGSVTTGAAARATTDSVFSNRRRHDEAASTLSSLAQQSSGFKAGVPSDQVREAFEAYLDEFSALHWDMMKFQYQNVHHDEENHSQFVKDLVAAVLQPLQSIDADESTITSVSDAIQQLASTVADSSGNSTGETTLYSNFSISRNTPTQPVYYGIYFTILDVKHEVSQKSNVITSDADTWVFLFKLNSDLLVQYAQYYDQLTKSSVLDWINSHTI